MSKRAAFDVHNPATGELVATVAAATDAQVADAAARARASQPDWARAPFSRRARVITRFHDLILNRAVEILDTIQRESGKARRDAITEVATTAGTARYYCAHGERHLRERRHRGAVPLFTGARVVHKPHGVVGLITPWNYPFLLAIADALPALLAGNAVVIKPAEATPLSADLARDLLIESGLDPDLLSIVHGPGREVGRELIRRVDYVGFTGSTETGRAVAVAAAERLIPFSLELGGKNPMLVLDGTPIDNAVTGLLNGAFCNSGQTCISIERAYVQRSIYDQFVERAVERTTALRLGWSTGWDVDMGSLVSPEHATKVDQHVTDARDKGATVLVGGRRRPDLGDAFFEPTILADVDPTMQVHDNETFGPVVSLYPVRDEREALRLANASSYGLNGSVWAGSGRRAREVARGLEVGTAGINTTLMVYNSFDVPMGGVKQSGMGRRHGARGILRYVTEQSIVESPAAWGGYDSIPQLMTSPRRAGLLLKVFRAWRHIPGMR